MTYLHYSAMPSSYALIWETISDDSRKAKHMSIAPEQVYKLLTEN